MVTKLAGKQQGSHKSLKTKYKTLKELENNTLHKDVAPHFSVSKIIFFTRKKNKEKIFRSYECDSGVKKVIPEQCEALNYVFKEWLLNLRSGNVPVNEPMHKEKTIN